MKIELKQGPSAPIPSTQANDAAQSARERAISRLVGTPPSAVQDQNAISPEEMGAIKSDEEEKKDEPVNESEQSEDGGQPHKVEEPKVEEPPKAKEDPLSTQYAALARKERAMREQARQIKAQEAALQSREEAMKSEYGSKYVPKERIMQDPIGALAEMGLSYDQITEMMLTRESGQDLTKNPVVAQLQAEIKALKDAQEKANKSQEDQQQNAYKQAVAQLRKEANQVVFTDPAYEMVKETNSVNDVIELIEHTFKEDGILMTVEEAAAKVEEYLVEEALKLARSKKIQDRLKPVAPAQKLEEPKKSQPTAMKTLSNAVSGSGQLTPRQRAIAAFEGSKK